MILIINSIENLTKDTQLYCIDFPTFNNEYIYAKQAYFHDVKDIIYGKRSVELLSKYKQRGQVFATDENISFIKTFFNEYHQILDFYKNEATKCKNLYDKNPKDEQTKKCYDLYNSEQYALNYAFNNALFNKEKYTAKFPTQIQQEK